MASWSSPTAPAALIHPGARQHEGRGEQPEQGAFKSPRPRCLHPSSCRGWGCQNPQARGKMGLAAHAGSWWCLSAPQAPAAARILGCALGAEHPLEEGARGCW